MRVLLVDDDEQEAQASESAIRARLGDVLELHREATLRLAIRALAEHSFDVILLELSLSDATGIGTLAGVRGAAPSLPVVVYTREMDDALALRALRAGAQECMCKRDVRPQQLARVLQFAMERQRRLVTLDAARVEAAHRATHDPLTGLANRDLFLDQLDRALAYGTRYGHKTGVLFVDLDGFKGINDEHGHARGDLILKAVSARLLDCVRRSDAVARLGGDEFVLLLPDVTSRRDIAHVREMILTCLRDPIDVGGGQLLIARASVGGAMSPLDGVTAQELLDAADADMYRDKSQRRRPSPASGAQAVLDVMSGLQQGVGAATTPPDSAPHRREARLRDALRAREFEVHFQPVVDVLSNRIIGAEALVRWCDPDRGLTLPEAFLTLAEDTGLIVPLGEQVLRDACKAVARWRRVRGCETLRVCVNLSAVQLRERTFSKRVATILEETSCPADAIVFELTENSMLIDGEIAIESLRELKKLGVRLVVDDFGVGYASLTFIREAPLDGIKLDRRFVTNMLNDARDHAIVAAMVRLAHGLKLDVTAEGVESAEHAQRLARLHCFAQQGRHFSAPVKASEIDVMLYAGMPAVAGADDNAASRVWRTPKMMQAVGFTATTL